MTQLEKINLLSLNYVSGKLGLHKSTVSRHIKAGRLPCCRIGSRVLIREQDLIVFIEKHISVGESSGSREGVHYA